ncbi:hypothetical protein K493DRAFT_412202 [Basidiobolus meristosporus CBS 931.73]|uniref:FAD-binding domain-containing protein n=1 Tax=Basidiobolus meristosporus CBS 931.73 TaxID=1314790 RepID=A0A1Y1X2L5_9FUNG|nr:hypothetical protein K493DRAFT_412484 [Basidiobolus meristosporus CBS 931.73]ORX80049.1 hypothetical protein K493DRAFT_412202 [Basidiobolus meristosporus CBS 931.73]|eukprot:ORX77466.1 hypothetical protein K493DRAFT_412484 [Basidiobolus meristosporus CBS 931.73]
MAISLLLRQRAILIHEKLDTSVRSREQEVKPRNIAMWIRTVSFTSTSSLSKAGLTLIGDAAHLMSPIAGAGVNMVLWDGKELALTIANATKSSKPLAAAITDYEKKMYGMTCPAVALSASKLSLISSAASVSEIVEVMARAKSKVRS